MKRLLLVLCTIVAATVSAQPVTAARDELSPRCSRTPASTPAGRSCSSGRSSWLRTDS